MEGFILITERLTLILIMLKALGQEFVKLICVVQI